MVTDILSMAVKEGLSAKNDSAAPEPLASSKKGQGTKDHALRLAYSHSS